MTIQGNPDDKRHGDKATVNVSKNVGALGRLSLAYYATPIGVALCHETILAYSLFYLTGLKEKVDKVMLGDVVRTALMIQDIFKNEFLFMDGPAVLDEQKIKQILVVAHEKGIADVNFETGEIVPIENSVAKNSLRFLRDLLQSYVDSYLIVAQTISCLQEMGVTIEQSKLLSQLHLSIQELHNDGIIKYMNSCLIEVLQTAFGRFSELGVCEA